MSELDQLVNVDGTKDQTQPESTEPQVIPASNPTPEQMEELRAAIKETYNFDVDVKPFIFRFKKTKDKETGLESVREAVELALPIPSVEGIVAIMQKGGKGYELLLDAIEGVILQAAREIISDDVNINAANFPVDQVSWEFIANLPKAQRRGGGIPKEVWEAFAQDYLEVMPGVTGKTPQQVANAAKILQNKLAQVKTNEPVLKLMAEQLAVYAENSPNVEDYQECVEFLLNKVDTFLNVSPEELLKSL